jgi:hypothetical protein
MSAANWIEKIIGRCQNVKAETKLQDDLIAKLVEVCYQNKSVSENGIGNLFAAAFDLVISTEYYTKISHSGWLYCPENESRLFFPFTNCCPRHAIFDQFFFHPSNKPSSGVIGTATARLLLLFYQAIFKYNNFSEIILRGTEPVDAVIINETEKKVLFAEIKASPLITLPLSSVSEHLTEEIDGEIFPVAHKSDVQNLTLNHSQIDLFVPQFLNNQWQNTFFSLGNKQNENDSEFGYRGILNLLNSDDAFFPTYFAFWNASLTSYFPKSNKNIFWLTNACGTPFPIPENWQKRRRGQGFESISDSKTSVGMDRTDDVKKGIYQVLKLGAEGKKIESDWEYQVGIISNIHPARHFDEYLKSLKDIVWTEDKSGTAKYVKDLPDDQKIFNLFDGIVALTQTYSRDEWIARMFSAF